MEKAFRRYPSIANSYREETIDFIRELGFTRGEWTVQEKIHGANFSIWLKGDEIFFGKRSGFLKPDSNFFGFQRITKYITPTLIKVVKEALKNFGYIVEDEVVLYGELAGGIYPHEKVEKVKEASKVQDGVYYNPDTFISIFDVYVEEAPISEIDFYALASEVQKHEDWPNSIIWSKELFRGSFDECLEYKNDGPSTVSTGCFLLPPIMGNIMEGVVIKPIMPLFYPNGGRVVLKNKNEKFAENKDTKIPKEPIAPLEGVAKALADNLTKLINENRLHAVLSKEEQFTEKQFGVLLKLFTTDIMDEFLKDNKDMFSAQDKSIQKRITKLMSKLSADLIRPNWLNIVDGRY